MALYDNIDNQVKKKKQKLNNRHIRNLKIMNILNALVMAFLIVIDIFLLIKGIFTGMPTAVTVLLIIFVVAQTGSLVVFSIKRFARASMVTKVGIIIICFLPLIPYFIYISIGNNIYIACLLARIIGLAALAMLLFNTKVTNDKKTFGVKGVPLAIASGFAFLTLLYILVSTTNRKIIYQYDKMYNGYVVNNVLAGQGKVKIKDDAVAISDGALKNVSGNLVIPKNVKYISEEAFKDSKITSLTIQSDNIELMKAVNNSNIEKIYLEANSSSIDIENLDKDIDIETNREVVDQYRETYRKYDYYFVPKLNEGEYYVCYNGTSLPVYIYTEEKSLSEPDKSSLPSSVDGRSILYDGYYVFNNEINFPLKVSSNTKIACKYSYVYNISYDFSDCENTYNLPDSYYNKLGDINLPELHKDGYQFKGWYDTDEYGNYTKEYKKLDNSVESDINLKAKFLKEFTVTFDKILDDAEFDSETEIVYVVGDEVDLIRPTRQGFTFAGWYLDQNYQFEATSTINKDVTLYAKWIINNTITLSDNIDKTFNNESSLVTVDAETEIDDVEISYKWYDANNNLKIEDNSFSVKNASDSSNYYAIITLNYNDGFIVNEIRSDDLVVNIKKEKYDMTNVIINNYEDIYDGKYHTPLVVISSLPIGLDGIQITAKFEEGIKDVGTKEVVCNFETKSNNYEIPESMAASVTITKRVVGVQWDSQLSFEYDGTEKYPTFTLTNVVPEDKDNIDGAIEIHDEQGAAGGYAVGNYIASVSELLPKGTSNVYKNYELSSDLSKTSIEYSIVSKSELLPDSYIVFDETVKVEYDGEAHLPNVEIYSSGVTANYSVEPVKAGTYNVEITFTTTDPNMVIANKYNSVVTITPRVLEIDWTFKETTYSHNETQIPEPIFKNRVGNDAIDLDYSTVESYAAGTYPIQYLSITGEDASNYALPEKVVGKPDYEYTILPEAIDVPLDNLGFDDMIGENSYIYDGTNKYPIINQNNLPNGVVVQYSGYGKAAGTYTVTATFSINSNNFVVSPETSSKSITVVIKPIVAQISWGQLSFDYDEKEHVPSATLGNLIPGDECTVVVIPVDVDAAIDTGDYAAEAIRLSNTNYILPSDTNLTTTNFSIKPKDYDFNFEFNSISVEYDGLNHKPVVVFEGEVPEWLTIEYSSDGITDVGTKQVTATFGTTTPGYKYPSPVTATVTITSREAQIEFTLPSDTTYNGEAIYPTARVINAVSGQEPEVVLNSGENNIEAGIYTVYAIYIKDNNNNYVITEHIGYTYEIKKATYDVSGLSFEQITETYNGSIHRPIVNGLDSIVGLDGIAVTANYTEGLVNVGSRLVTATFNVSRNYEAITPMTATVTVTPKVVGLNWNDDTFKYTGNVIKPKCVLSGLVGDDSCDVTVNAQGVNVGTYTASASNLTNPNYALPSEVTWTYEIVKATVDTSGFVFTETNKVYDGTYLYPEVTGLPQYVTVSYSGLLSNVGIHPITVKFTVTDDNYENNISDRTVNVTIEKRMVSIEWTVLEVQYTGNIVYPRYILNNLVSGDDCELTMTGASSEIGEHTVTITGLTNDNYDLESYNGVTYTIVTTGYDMSGVKFENAEMAYNGSLQYPTITGDLPEGLSVSYSGGATNVSEGTVVVTASFTSIDPDSVYQLPEPMTATIKILPKEINASWSNTTFTYDGKIHVPSTSLSGIINGDFLTITLSQGKINAGNYICTIEDIGNSNYKVSDSTKSSAYFINKANYDMSGIKLEDVSYIYDGLPHTGNKPSNLESVVGLDGISPTANDPTGYATNVSEGKVLCTVTFNTTSANYNIPEPVTCYVSITPITLDLTITLDTDNTATAYIESSYYRMNRTYDGLSHKVNVTPDSTKIIGSDTVTFGINGEFKNYRSTAYIFDITSNNTNYVSTYTKFYVYVSQVNTGCWWNNTEVHWWGVDPTGFPDVVLVYVHQTLNVEYEEYPTVYGSYKMKYISKTDNVVVSSQLSSAFTIDLTEESLMGLVNIYDSDGNGLIMDYEEVYIIDQLNAQLTIPSEEVTEIIEKSYEAIFNVADEASALITFEKGTSNAALPSNDSICTVSTGATVKSGLAPKEYYGQTFKYAIKMESATRVTLDFEAGSYSYIIIVTANGGKYLSINGASNQIDSDGVMRYRLSTTATQITLARSGTESHIYAIILVP